MGITDARKRKVAPTPAPNITLAVEPVSKVSEDRNRYFVNTWQALPAWQQDNEYICSGYRPSSGSLVESLKSLGHIHNETVNIYSHIFGAILFATIPFYVYGQAYHRYATATFADIIVFSTFFFGVAICFLLSATFHIINNHSESVAVFGNQLDYLGIVVLMWGSTIPTVYYGFICNPGLQRLYWAMISIFAFACTVATLDPDFRRPRWRPYRSAMYSGLGLSAIIFIVHGLFLYDWDILNQRMGLDWMGLMAVLNLIGAVTYATRIPEKWHPYKYDIVGSSHQVLHIMVILAGLAHMVGLFRAFDFIHSQISLCS